VIFDRILPKEMCFGARRKREQPVLFGNLDFHRWLSVEVCSEKQSI